MNGKAIKISNVKPALLINILNQQEKLILVLLIISNISGIADIISNNKKQRTDKFAFEFTGYIKDRERWHLHFLYRFR
jgi:hypothetical protein